MKTSGFWAWNGALLHTTDCSRQLSLQYKQLQYFTTPTHVFVLFSLSAGVSTTSHNPYYSTVLNYVLYLSRLRGILPTTRTSTPLPFYFKYIPHLAISILETYLHNRKTTKCYPRI
ncbi:hypothetical protein P153DRAFT_204913 [Dothidotthia symphoricarpi CBS 119687]|uniref:Uncharacterized protein n=1 Tax=Dothidotthia symphoricarpi CBS 119687 TaxID=1392245 RepID=A0A6A6AI63_9PLEO|nr:uncharacterized protein P153DRAFT_204913 [Dothidotthia symphoricarpi CBS 119687]KAF2130795.1 hypothetical protein P153DRAFT_204913 [Dothidotthia symphoricarpi CBS 119687]